MTARSFRHSIRVLPVVVALCLTGLAAGASGSGNSRPSSQASQLAAQAAGSTSAAGRLRALVAIAKALGLPVFTAKGKALSPGNRTLPASFNLYDFQLGAAAAAFGRHDSTTIAGLTQVYAQAGGRIAAAAMASRLGAAVRSAVAKPASPSSLLALIVRDIGLHDHPAVDLARPTTPATKLDPLQALLIAADSALHSIGTRKLSAVSRAARSRGSCEGSTETGIVPPLITVAVPGLAGSDLMKALLAIQSTEITVVNTPFRETHYGPPGHAALAGQKLRLGFHVELRYKLPADVLCGLLAGKGYPPEGPLKNRPMFWKIGDLLKYGTIEFDPPDMTSGSTGTSTLIFTPRSEDFPGFGAEYKATGEVSATAGGPQTATAGLLTASQSWTVGYHKPRGFKFQLPTFTFKNTAGKDTITITDSVQGQVCGDDPFSKPWNITESVSPGGGTVTYPETLFENTSVTSGAGSSLTHDWTLFDQPATAVSPLKLRLQITPGAPAQGSFDPPTETQEAYVFEDKSCPDNSEGG